MIQKKNYEFRILERVNTNREQEYVHKVEALSEEDAKAYAYKFFSERNYENEKTLIAEHRYSEVVEHEPDTVVTLFDGNGNMIAQDRY